jgi:hypothetical protein
MLRNVCRKSKLFSHTITSIERLVDTYYTIKPTSAFFADEIYHVNDHVSLFPLKVLFDYTASTYFLMIYVFSLLRVSFLVLIEQT